MRRAESHARDYPFNLRRGRKLCGFIVARQHVFFAKDEYFMRLAIREAERALEHDDVPIGAVVVQRWGGHRRRAQRA